MKPHLPSFILGAAIACGAFLLMGQARAPQGDTPGRYQIQAAQLVDGVYVLDTMTGEIRFSHTVAISGATRR